MGQFAIENIQNEWKVYVKKSLDREEKDHYLLNITATDGTFAAKAVVEVKVLDANDNSPVCEKVGRVLYHLCPAALIHKIYIFSETASQETGKQLVLLNQ